MKLNIMHVIMFGGGAILIYCGIKDVNPLELLAGEVEPNPVKAGGGGRQFGKPRGGGGGRRFDAPAPPSGSGAGGVRPA